MIIVVIMQVRKKVFSNMCGQFMTEFPWSILVSIVTTKLNRNRASNNMLNLFTMELHMLVNIGTIRIHRNIASNYMWKLFIMDINIIVIIVKVNIHQSHIWTDTLDSVPSWRVEVYMWSLPEGINLEEQCSEPYSYCSFKN